MEEICNKEKELRALVQVTGLLYERNNEMTARNDEQNSLIERLE
jgi:hypothetical protein